MSNYDIWKEDGSNHYNSSQKDILTNYRYLCYWEYMKMCLKS